MGNVTVKICGGYKIFLCFPANKWAGHSFMDVGRRLEIPEAEMKHFITLSWEE